MNVAFDPKLIDHLELREKALKERDARALYQMAQIYASMKGKKNEKKAYELYKSSATHGYAKARFMMGLCNEKGIGVKQSLPMAITWYIRAEISAASDIADRSDTADEMDRERLHIFREEPGFATVDAGLHDDITAAISHVPHIVAASLVNMVRENDTSNELMKTFAAGGFKDITRIASSSPEMWESICLSNADSIDHFLSLMIDELTKMRSYIANEQGGEINRFFASSREYRDSIH